MGPFRINKGATGLHLNKFSWNNVANVLFLETPAGVGFSYSNRSSDLLDTGDRRTCKILSPLLKTNMSLMHLVT